MTNQSLLNGSINASLQYSSFGEIRCDLFMYEIDDIITNSNAMYSPNVNHYCKYNRKEFNKHYLIIKYNEINKIKTNIINNKKQYIMLNILFYETIWVILSIAILPVVIVIGAKHFYGHYIICYDCYKQIIKTKTFLCVSYNTKIQYPCDYFWLIIGMETQHN